MDPLCGPGPWNPRPMDRFLLALKNNKIKIMLTNMVIYYVTFGSAQQIRSIIFRWGVLCHTGSTFLNCLFIYVSEKMASDTLHYLK